MRDCCRMHSRVFCYSFSFFFQYFSLAILLFLSRFLPFTLVHKRSGASFCHDEALNCIGQRAARAGGDSSSPIQFVSSYINIYVYRERSEYIHVAIQKEKKEISEEWSLAERGSWWQLHLSAANTIYVADRDSMPMLKRSS